MNDPKLEMDGQTEFADSVPDDAENASHRKNDRTRPPRTSLSEILFLFFCRISPWLKSIEIGLPTKQHMGV